ncbi:hypothetical protein L218DRAFT_1081502 [Marasmius fiardii PR-910]|nr:hypothetical protein L218DRAFT_1081502 [Marasmius fiardii PR-910]
MAQEYAPKLGAGISLLNLFGLTSTLARICATFILTIILGYIFLRYRYPCHSPTSLMVVVDQATTLFNRCVAVHAFREGDYDRFKMLLQQITACASEIAARSHLSRTGGSLHREYIEWMSFLWARVIDTVECHHETQALIRDLEVCLMRASHSRAQYDLHTRRASPQA